jgi:hypothetical protein
MGETLIHANAAGGDFMGLLKCWVVGVVLIVSASAMAQTTQPNLAKAPEGAVVLFDGVDTSKWQMKDGSDCGWKVVEGALEVTPKAGDLYTKDKFEDCTLHVEFRTPVPAEGDKGQHRGNSGVIMQDMYEVQVLESYGLTATKGDCGSVYNIKAPDKNMALKPMEWQSYDITYRAPRFDDAGKKTENARITLVWNGEKVQDNVEIPHRTRSGKLAETAGPGPVQLQDHGFKVQYRNIWIVPNEKK